MMLIPNNAPRHEMMDASRGFAIVGILWLNIFIFGLPFDAVVIPGIWGDANTANIAVWNFVSIGVSGVMRGMISMLFGAAALIMLQRAEDARDGIAAVDRFFRRLLWLIAFGIFHSYILLWPHDILYVYGVLGLMIFPFRNLSIKPLLAIGCVMLLGSIFFTAQNSNEIQSAQSAVEDALTDEEIDRLRRDDPLLENFEDFTLPVQPSSWQRSQHNGFIHFIAATAQTERSKQTQEEAAATAEFNEMLKRIGEDIAERQQGYWENFKVHASQSFDEQTDEMLTNHLWDVATFFIFGMVLFKQGFFFGQWRTSSYLSIFVGGYGLGVALGLITSLNFDEGTSLDTVSMAISQYTYDVRRLLLVLANFSLIALCLRFGLFKTSIRALTACGRMAFSLYIGQTIVCNFLFLGFGLGLYGELEHFEIAMIAVILTVLQLIAAPLYFRRFSQGPLEWLMRTLVAGNSGAKAQT